jgi:D-alanine-D-alanine ligase
MRIAVLANLKSNAPRLPGMMQDQWDDLDSPATVNAIVKALQSAGHEADFFEGDLSLIELLPPYQPDLCFNICEGHAGDSRESHVPVLLEMLRIPYTGSGVLTLALTLDKPMTKRVLSYHDLPTPPFQALERANEPLEPELVFPLFVKPSREGTGMGISARSIVNNEEELRERVAEVLERYQQPALVERYIRGREVTVGVLGNLTAPVARRLPQDLQARRVERGLSFLPALEVALEAYPESEGGVYTNRIKSEWADRFQYRCPAPLPESVVERLNFLTAAAFRITGCRDVARMDFRLDEDDDDMPYILEINPLPGLAPGVSDLVIEAEAAGMSHAGLVNAIVQHAAARLGME